MANELYFGYFLERKNMERSRTRIYTEALQNEGVPENLAKNAAVVMNQDSVVTPRTERGQRVVTRAFEASINNREEN
jgi:hypothetical protein